MRAPTYFLPTLSDPPPGLRKVDLEDQYFVAKLAVAKVLKLNNIKLPCEIEDIPEEVRDEIDQVLHALGVHTWEAWEPPAPRKTKVEEDDDGSPEPAE